MRGRVDELGNSLGVASSVQFSDASDTPKENIKAGIDISAGVPIALVAPAKALTLQVHCDCDFYFGKTPTITDGFPIMNGYVLTVPVLPGDVVYIEGQAEENGKYHFFYEIGD